MRTQRRHRAHQRRTSTRRATHRPASTRPWRILATTLLTGLLLAGGWLLWQQHIIPPGSRTGHQLPVLGDPLVTRQPGNLSEATDLPASSTTPIVPSINTISLAPADPALAQSMLEAINQDRQAHGLKPVAWDDTAAYAGALHAADMATHDYFSHWNRSGYGPEYRYNRVGGRDSVMENISTYSYRFDDGRPAPITDFMPIIEQAQTGLMNSPGHRANILKPEHTHVGIGFAYNPETGSFYLAQEFVNRYVEMQPLPLQAEHDTVLLISGTLLPDAHKPNINLTYQPFPQPMGLTELNATSSYSRDADIYQAISPNTEPDGTFAAQIQLDNQGQAGIYSVRVWVEIQKQSILASEWLIAVH